MPKTFSDREREYIRDKLKSESRLLFSQYGVKKTTVDEIVKRVKIPKGTFYLFYESKELLLFDIIMEEQAAIQGELINAVAGLGGKITKERFSALIYALFKRATESFLFPVFTNGEYELIFRKLPPEALARNIKEDNKSIEKLFSLIPQAKGKDMSVYGGAIRGITLLALHKDEIGELIFDDALKLLIDGLTEKLFEV
ncbi:MAG: TetR/AcrR family transcriptional regulator [Eubacteriales bacterium]|nr:TetR/AcrR family transcriptional regulator [Eubacteriales bacterium]